MQDAFNLGWKLAAVVRGDQDQTLLDTYESERRPVAARVLTNTRAQTALTRPDPQIEALRQVLTGLTTFGDVNRSLAEMIAALDIRYPLLEGAGHHVPDLDLPDGTRLYSHLHDARPVLLGREGQKRVKTVAWDDPAMLIRPDGHVGLDRGDGRGGPRRGAGALVLIAAGGVGRELAEEGVGA